MVKPFLKNLISKQKVIPVTHIKLDKENPRYSDQFEPNKSELDENKLLESIGNDDLSDIDKSIKEHGVLDPVWVIETTPNHYSVIEGSRRLFVLNKLLEDGAKPPSGVTYKKVRANIISKKTPKELLDIQRVLLQTGKKPWGPYNEAFVIHKLAEQNLDSSYIAKVMGMRSSSVDKELANYELYTQYVKFLEKRDLKPETRKYTYFQRAGKEVRKKFFSNQSGLYKFFKLITPDGDKKARISSVSLDGGLMHFNTIAQDEEILQEFLDNPEMTVQQALIMYRGKHLIGEFPWLKKMVELAEKIKDLDSKEYEKFKKNRGLNREIRAVSNFCKKILED